MKIVLGIIMMIVGIAMVVKTETVLKIFGRMAFFEEHLGTEGGSRLGYKMIGLVVFFLGLITATGMVGGFMNWLLGPIFDAGSGSHSISS